MDVFSTVDSLLILPLEIYTWEQRKNPAPSFFFEWLLMRMWQTPLSEHHMHISSVTWEWPHFQLDWKKFCPSSQKMVKYIPSLSSCVNKGKQKEKKISWRKLIKSSLEKKSGGGNLPWRLGVDLAGAAQSRRWELSSRTCLAVLRKSKQPDKCLAAHPRTTLRNVLPTSAPASVAVAGDRQTERVPGSRRIPLGAPSCTQDKRREGSPRWKPISKILLKNANDD